MHAPGVTQIFIIADSKAPFDIKGRAQIIVCKIDPLSLFLKFPQMALLKMGRYILKALSSTKNHLQIIFSPDNLQN